MLGLFGTISLPGVLSLLSLVGVSRALSLRDLFGVLLGGLLGVVSLLSVVGVTSLLGISAFPASSACSAGL